MNNLNKSKANIVQCECINLISHLNDAFVFLDNLYTNDNKLSFPFCISIHTLSYQSKPILFSLTKNSLAGNEFIALFNSPLFFEQAIRCFRTLRMAFGKDA